MIASTAEGRVAANAANAAANAVAPRVVDAVDDAIAAASAPFEEPRGDGRAAAARRARVGRYWKSCGGGGCRRRHPKASAREAGSARALARDVAAARVDQREGIERVAGLVREASEEAVSRRGSATKATVVGEARRAARPRRRRPMEATDEDERTDEEREAEMGRSAATAAVVAAATPPPRRKPPKHSPGRAAPAGDRTPPRPRATASASSAPSTSPSETANGVFTARMDPEQWVLLGERRGWRTRPRPRLRRWRRQTGESVGRVAPASETTRRCRRRWRRRGKRRALRRRIRESRENGEDEPTRRATTPLTPSARSRTSEAVSARWIGLQGAATGSPIDGITGDGITDPSSSRGGGDN